MIVQRQRTGRLAIRQEDHAAFAAFILEHWAAHSFPNHPDRDRIILATREHESGWSLLDSNPRLDAKSHLPVDFTKVTPEEAHAVWTRAVKKFVKDEPFVALLITHHAYSFHEANSRRDSKWKPFFIEFARWRAQLRDQLGLTHNEVEHPYSFIRMADWFALHFAADPKLGMERPERYAGYGVRRSGNQFLFRPYPFNSRALVYQLPVYPMPAKGFASEKEAKAAMKKPELLEITFGPLPTWD